MTSFSIHNFGCRVNQAEAFAWADEFQARGLKFEADWRSSDIVLVNTCTLTGRADSDARQFVRKISRLNPGAKIVVTGCLAERSPREFRDDPLVWRTFTNREKKRLAEEVLSSVKPEGKAAAAISYRSRALLKVQDGCDFRCAFCVIPRVRGGSRSVPPGEVIARAREFVRRGFREIVLTGVHICSYGPDLQPRSSFLGLLEDLARIEGLGKIRLSSLDPRFLTKLLLEFITRNPKICPHFHLSLQHGSDRILKLMGRGESSVRAYAGILDCLRRNAPDAVIGADVIVGFPGETGEDFEATRAFLEESPLDYFHVFSYSPRPGTRAPDLPAAGSAETKERASRLRRVSAGKNRAFRERFAGRELDGVVIRRKGSAAEILTSNYLRVFVPSCPAGERDEVRVRIAASPPDFKPGSSPVMSGTVVCAPNTGNE